MVCTSTSEGVPRLLKRNERVKLCKDKVVTHGGVPSSAIDQDEGNDQHHHQQHEEVGVPRDGVAFSPLMVVALWMSILIAASPLAALAFSLAALVAGSRRSALVGLLCSTRIASGLCGEAEAEHFLPPSVRVVEHHVHIEGVGDLVRHLHSQVVLVGVWIGTSKLILDQLRFLGHLVIEVDLEVGAGEDCDVGSSMAPVQVDSVPEPGLDSDVACQLNLKLSHSF